MKPDLAHYERAWRAGSIPALVDAIILCHEEQTPIPLWLAQATIALIGMLFEGKSLQRRGRNGKATARYKNAQIHYARWDAVCELKDRRDELIRFVKTLSITERDRRPAFANLVQDKSLEARCAAVAELFDSTKDPAMGSPATIERSYKKVQKDLKRGAIGLYFIPSLRNPLHRLLK